MPRKIVRLIIAKLVVVLVRSENVQFSDKLLSLVIKRNKRKENGGQVLAGKIRIIFKSDRKRFLSLAEEMHAPVCVYPFVIIHVPMKAIRQENVFSLVHVRTYSLLRNTCVFFIVCKLDSHKPMKFFCVKYVTHWLV